MRRPLIDIHMRQRWEGLSARAALSLVDDAEQYYNEPPSRRHLSHSAVSRENLDKSVVM